MSANPEPQNSIKSLLRRFAESLHEPGADIAWLRAPSFANQPERLYWATYPRNSPNGCPHSAVTELIEGIYRHDPAMARKIVRNRIHTTRAELTPLCRGMVKVAAKRISTGCEVPKLESLIHSGVNIEEVRSEPDPQSVCFDSAPEANLRSDEQIADFLKGLNSPSENTSPLYSRDRAVAALLLDARGKVLATSRNSNATVRTRHAELNLIQNWWKRHRAPLPEGSSIWVTLKPCRMCAGAIWQAASDPRRIRAWYLEDDPGSNARMTVLDPLTSERVQAVREAGLSSEWAKADLQRQWRYSHCTES